MHGNGFGARVLAKENKRKRSPWRNASAFVTIDTIFMTHHDNCLQSKPNQIFVFRPTMPARLVKHSVPLTVLSASSCGRAGAQLEVSSKDGEEKKKNRKSLTSLLPPYESAAVCLCANTKRRRKTANKKFFIKKN